MDGRKLEVQLSSVSSLGQVPDLPDTPASPEDGEATPSSPKEEDGQVETTFIQKGTLDNKAQMVADLTETEMKLVTAAFGRLKNADKKERIVGAWWVQLSKNFQGTHCIALSQTRIAYMKKEKKKFDVKEWGYVCLLKVLSSKSNKHLELKIAPKLQSAEFMHWRELDLLPEDHVNRIVTAIYRTHAEAFLGNISIDLKAKFRLVPGERKSRLPIVKEDSVPLGGFLPAYVAYCGAYALVPDRNVLRFCRSSALATKKQKLILTDIPDIDRPGYNFAPIFSALRYNKWFKHLVIKNLSVRHSMFHSDNLLKLLEKNDTLETVVINKIEGSSGDFVAVANSLQKNFINHIQVYDFSDNSLGDKGLSALCPTIRKFDIRAVRMNGVGAGAGSVAQIYRALLENITSPQTLQTLSFSRNKLGAKGGKDLEQFLRNLDLLNRGKLELDPKKKKKPKKGEEPEPEPEEEEVKEVKSLCIRNLSFSETGIELSSVLDPLIDLRSIYSRIQKLDISMNKLNPKKDIELICTLLTGTESIMNLDVHGISGMTLPILGDILDAYLVKNKLLYSEDEDEEAYLGKKYTVELNLSNLDLSPKMYTEEMAEETNSTPKPQPPTLFLSVLQKTKRIRAINLANCKMGNENMILVSETFKGKIKLETLAIGGQNVVKSGTKKTMDQLVEVTDNLLSAKRLSTLDLSGASGKHMATKDLKVFYDLCISHKGIVDIDVSHNAMGDSGAKDLAHCIKNAQLNGLMYDDNGYSVDGLKYIKDAVLASDSIFKMPYPATDVAAIAKAHAKKVEQLGTIVSAMQKKCNQNRTLKRKKSKKFAAGGGDDEEGEDASDASGDDGEEMIEDDDGTSTRPSVPPDATGQFALPPLPSGDDSLPPLPGDSLPPLRTGGLDNELPPLPDDGLPPLPTDGLDAEDMPPAPVGIIPEEEEDEDAQDEKAAEDDDRDVTMKKSKEMAKKFGKSKKVSPLPPEVKSAVAFLLEKGIDTEYIFRGEFDQDVVDQCIAQLSEDPNAAIDQTVTSPHDMAQVLLTWLENEHETEPLVPQDVYDQCISANFMPGADAKADFMKNVFQPLPARNRAILRYVYLMLSRMAKNENNGMDARELASVFRPVLLCASAEGGGFGDQMEIDLIVLVIEHADVVFAKEQKDPGRLGRTSSNVPKSGSLARTNSMAQ